MGWFQNVTKAISGFFRPATNFVNRNVVQPYNRYNQGAQNTVRRGAQNIQRGARQVQQNIPKPPPPPHLDFSQVFHAINNLPQTTGFKPVQGGIPQNVVAGLKQGFSKVGQDLPTNIVRANPAALPLQLTPFKPDLTRVVDAANNKFAQTGVGKNKVVKFGTQNLVKPIADSAARAGDVISGQQRYAPGLKGAAQLGTDAFNLGGLAYTPAKAGILAKGGKAALKVAPEAFLRGVGAGTGISAINQYANDGKLNLKDAALSGLLAGGLNVAVPLAGGYTKRGIQAGTRNIAENAPKIAASEVGAVGKNVEGDIYYHTTTPEAAAKIRAEGYKGVAGDRTKSAAVNSEGVYLYKNDVGAAQEFAKNFKNGSEVIPNQVEGKIFKSRSQTKSIRSLAEDKVLINKLKSEGYVGIQGDELGTPVTFVFDTKAIKPRGAVGKNVNPKEVKAYAKSFNISEKQAAKELSSPAPKVNEGLPETLKNTPKTAKDKPLELPTQSRAKPYNKTQFEDATNKYLGSVEAGRTRGAYEGRAFKNSNKLTPGEELQAIKHVDEGTNSANPKIQKAVEEFRKFTDVEYKRFTQDKGMKLGYIQEYLPRIYKNPQTGEALTGAEYRALGLKSGRQVSREAQGLDVQNLAHKNLPELAQAYTSGMEKAAAGQRYLRDLQNNGLIMEAPTRPQGLQAVDAPGFPEPKTYTNPETGNQIQGRYYAEPKVAAQINKIFGADVRGLPGTILKGTARASSTAQDIGLAGGIPGTPINAFGFAQNLRHMMGGSIRAPLKADALAMSKRLSNRYFDKHAADLAEIQSQGIPIRTNYAQNSLKNFGERLNGLVDSGQSRNKGTALVKEVWNSAVNDPTFSRFMPIMQTEYYRHVRDNLVKVGVSKGEASKIAGSRLLDFEGLNTMAKNATRSKVGNDAVTTFLFAPKYRESMINFWVKNAKALIPTNTIKALNPRNGAYRNNVIFDAAALGTFLYMDSLNQKYNDGRHLWDNPAGKQDKLLIKLGDGRTVGVPFLSSIATIPRTALNVGKDIATGDSSQLAKDASGFLGYGIRPLVDVATNENYFGNKIRNPDVPINQQIGQVGKYLFSQYQHPYVKAALNATETDTSQKKPTYQVASEALELPFRFYKDSSIKRGLVEQDFKKDWTGASNSTKQAFQRWHPGANEFGAYEDQPDNPAYTRERAVAYQDNGLFNLEKKYAEAQNKRLGKPIDPVFNLPENLRRKVLWKQSLPPGTKDPELDKLYQQDWYQDFRNQQSKYFDAKRSYNLKQADQYAKQGNTDLANKIRNSVNSKDNPYPVTPDGLQKTMDYYSNLPKGTGARSSWIRANPKLWTAMTNQWAAIDNWQNQERAKLGLDATEGATGIANGYKTDTQSNFKRYGYGSGGGSTKEKRIPYRQPSVKNAKLSLRAPKAPRVSRAQYGSLFKKPKAPKIARLKLKV